MDDIGDVKLFSFDYYSNNWIKYLKISGGNLIKSYYKIKQTSNLHLQ